MDFEIAHLKKVSHCNFSPTDQRNPMKIHTDSPGRLKF
ncbi:hypothetical protein LEP1GSC203_3583 [Leptospira terpstrae serovar Hualin str. LT 11-33 = ATCC 700639]|uniref:Uncharacterized protein n=1 Tax=Leptospira terpstrae serovar Hualin str. LT 11-33 = ATCC 700639 TaxID=1257025 RepID=N1W151_9LEPT|nr:hypothetical protein LEP1GSC203_3583 [Leptospira terpstrae serovar Hualin str. LT 11-33 = ATCC 700639]